MANPTKAPRITIATDLLDAIGKWASTDETRPHIGVVMFNNGEAVATDGHRLVRVPLETHGMTFGIHRNAIAAIARAQRAMYDGDENEDDEIGLWVADGKLYAALDDRETTVLRLPMRGVKDYPPIDQIMIDDRETDEPGDFIFDPEYLGAIDEVCEAIGDRGVQIVGWTKITEGRLSGPMTFKSHSGIRFAVMPMKGTGGRG